MTSIEDDKPIVLPKPKPNSFTLDHYSARVFILKLEENYNLTIKVYESGNYCMICIDKEKKDE